MNPRVETVEYKGNYRLQLTFTNGEVKVFDLKNYLHYPVYEPLKDESFCRQAKVIDGIVTWNHEIDLDPDIAYLESGPMQAAVS